MNTLAGLAFAWLLLNDEQKEVVKKHWSRFPRGRYMLPLEMATLCQVELKKTLTDQELESMKSIWVDYCRKNNLSQDSLPYEAADWFAWLNYAGEYYRAPVLLSSSDWRNQ